MGILDNLLEGADYIGDTASKAADSIRGFGADVHKQGIVGAVSDVAENIGTGVVENVSEAATDTANYFREKGANLHQNVERVQKGVSDYIVEKATPIIDLTNKGIEAFNDLSSSVAVKNVKDYLGEYKTFTEGNEGGTDRKALTDYDNNIVKKINNPSWWEAGVSAKEMGGELLGMIANKAIGYGELDYKAGSNAETFRKGFEEIYGGTLSQKRIIEDSYINYKKQLEESGELNKFDLLLKVNKEIKDQSKIIGEDAAKIKVISGYDQKTRQELEKRKEEYSVIAQKDIEFQESMKKIEVKAKQYIRDNINIKEGEDPLEVVYPKQKKYEGTMAINKEITESFGSSTTDLVNQALLLAKGPTGKLIIKATKGFEKTIEQFGENRTTRERNKYDLIATEKDPVKREKINAEINKENNVMNKFDLGIIQFTAQLTAQGFDLEQAQTTAKQVSYQRLTEREQHIFDLQKIKANWQSYNTEKEKIAEDWNNNSLWGIYHAVTALGAGIGVASNTMVDAVVKGMSKDGEQNYKNMLINSKGASIVDSDKSTINKMINWAAYNPGDVTALLTSLWVPTKAFNATATVGKVGQSLLLSTATKGLTSAYKIPQLANYMDKTVKISTNIFGKSANFVVNAGKAVTTAPYIGPTVTGGVNTAKWLSTYPKYLGTNAVQSVLPTKVIDDIMGQVSTVSNERFNIIGDLFFDTTIFSIGKGGGKLLSGAKRTANNLSYDFIFGADKQIRDSAIKDLTDHLNSKGVKLNGEVPNINNTANYMRDYIVPLYKQTVDPYIHDKIFNKGELVNFITENVKKMDDIGMTGGVLTAEGIGFNMKQGLDPFEKIRKDLNDITELGKKSFLGGDDGKFYKTAFNNQLTQLENQIKGNNFKSLLGISNLESVSKLDKLDYTEALKRVRTAPTKDKLLTELDKLISQHQIINGKYSKMKMERTYTIYNSITGVKLNITESNLEKMKKLNKEGKTIEDHIAAGYIKVSSDDMKAGVNLDEGIYVFNKDKVLEQKKIDDLERVFDESKDFFEKEGLSLDEAVSKAHHIKEIVSGLTYSGTERQTVKGIEVEKFLSVGQKYTDEGVKDFIYKQIQFIYEQSGKILGESNVGKVDLGEELLKAKEVVGLTKKSDTYLSFAHGILPVIKGSKKHKVIFYMLPGSKLYKHTKVGKLLDKINIEVSVADYTNKSTKIVSDIIYNSKVENGILNIEEGILHIDKVTSSNINGYYDKGVLNLEKVNGMITESIQNYKKIVGDINFDGATEKELYKTIKDIVGNFNERADGLVTAIIKNITYKLLKNPESIKHLKNFISTSNTIGKGMDKVNFFKKFFMSENLINSINEGILAGKTIDMDSDSLLKLIDEEHRIYISNLTDRKNKIDEDLILYNKALKDIRITDKQASDIKDVRLELVEQLKAIEERLKISKEDFIKSHLEIFTDDAIQNKLRAMIGNISKADNELLKKYTKELETFKDSIKNKEVVDDLLKNLTSDELTRIKKIIKDIEGSNESNIEQILKEVENESEKVKEFIAEYDFNKSVNKTIKEEIINQDKIDDIVEKNLLKKNGIDLLEKDEMIKNNQIVRFIKSIFSDSDLEGEQLLQKNNILDGISKHFGGNEGLNITELYKTNGGFKNFIDGLKIKEDKKGGDLDKLISDKRKIYEDTMREIIASIFKDIKGLDKDKVIDMTSELIENAVRDKKIYNRMKGVSKIEKFEGKSFILVKNKEGFNELKPQVSFNTILPLEVGRLKQGLPGFGLIITNGSKAFGKVFKWNKKDNAFKEYFDNIQVVVDNELKPKLFISDIDKFKMINNMMNGRDITKKVKDETGEIREVIIKPIVSNFQGYRNSLGLEKDEFIVGTFGDKDSYFQKYKLPDNVIAEIKKKGLEKRMGVFTEMFYSYAYALVLGFKNSNNLTGKVKFELKNLEDEFIKIVKSNEGNANNYQDNFMNKLESIELKGVKKNGEQAVLGDYINKIDSTSKRESSGTYTDTIFDNIDKKGTLIVVDKKIDENNLKNILEKYESDYNGKKIYFEEDKINLYNDLVEELNSMKKEGEMDDTFEEYIYLKGIDPTEDQINGLISVLNTGFRTDVLDGWGAMSKDWAELYYKVNGAKITNKSVKTHLFGLTEKQEKFFAKALFNNKIIKDGDGNILNSTAVVSSSSLKLDAGFKKSTKAEYVIIDGYKHRVLGRIDISTKDFKEATSAIQKEKESLFIGSQVINTFTNEYKNAMLKINKEELKELWQQEVVDKLGKFKDNVDTFRPKTEQDIVDIINEYKKQGQDVGGFNDSIIGGYITNFLNKARQSINKGEENGMSVYIEKGEIADINGKKLKINEIMLNENSEIVKKAKSDLKKKIAEIESKGNIKDKEILKRLQKKLETNDLELVGFRDPVTSIYNLGVYKIKINNDLDVGNTVMHPYQVFTKIEGDHDGDHLKLVSSYSKKGNIMARAALDSGGEMKTDYKNLNEAGGLFAMDDRDFYRMLDRSEYKNRHILVTQVGDEVEKIFRDTTKNVEKVKEVKNKVTLTQSRFIASEAKGAVEIIQSTIRTARGLLRIIEDHLSGKDVLDKVIYESNLKSRVDFEPDEIIIKEKASNIKYTLDDILSNVKEDLLKLKNKTNNTEEIKKENIKLLNDRVKYYKDFDKTTSGIIQVVIDYAKSGKTEFPEGLIERIMGFIGEDYNKTKVIYDTIGQGLSMSYNANDKIKKNIFKYFKEDKFKDEYINKLVGEYATNKIGFKGELYEFLIKNFYDDIKVLNQSTELAFIKKALNNILNKYKKQPVQNIQEINKAQRYTEDFNGILKDNEVFVFGSNAKGIHGKGAAKSAKDKYGAIEGKAEGLQGNSYAIITKKDWRLAKSSSLKEIEEGIDKMLDFAKNNKDKTFIVTKIGSGLGGYTIEEIGEIFKRKNITSNIVLPKDYSNIDKVKQVEDSTINKNKISDITNHSGGARGSDSEWDNIGKEYGMINNNHYYYGKPAYKQNIKITEEQYKEGLIYAKQAAIRLGKFFSKNDYVRGLLSRNWQQVKNSTQILAIGSIDFSKQLVSGGTGYAVEMAKISGKEINTFDQQSNKWYNFNYSNNKFEEITTPILQKNFAGIGAREITNSGKKAIRDVYENTLNNIDNVNKVKKVEEQTNMYDFLKKFEQNTDAKGFMNSNKRTELLSMFNNSIKSKKLKDVMIDYDDILEQKKLELSKKTNIDSKDYDKELKIHEIFNQLDYSNLDEIDRIAMGLYGQLKGNFTIFNTLTIKQQLDFIKDNNLAKKKKISEEASQGIKDAIIELDKTKNKVKTITEITIDKELLDKTIKEVGEEIKKMEENNAYKYDIEQMKSQLKDMEDEYIELEKLEKSKKDGLYDEKIKNSYNKDVIENELSEIKIQPFNWGLVYDKNAINNLNKIGQGYIATRNRWFRLLLSDQLGTYDPSLLQRINMMTENSKIYNGNQLGTDNKEMFLKITQELKSRKIDKDNISEFLKSIDREFTSLITKTDQGTYIITGYEKILDKLTNSRINSQTGEPIYDFSLDTGFKEILDEYKTKIVEPVLNSVSDLERKTRGTGNSVNLYNYLNKPSDTLFNDFIGSLRNDSTFALRTLGIMDQLQLKERLLNTGMTARISNIITNELLPKNKGLEFIDKANALHYISRLGVGALGTGAGGFMGLSQILPNYYQIKSYTNFSKKDTYDADILMEKYPFLDSESTLRFGSGLDSNLTDIGILNAFGTFLRKTGEYSAQQLNRFGKIVDEKSVGQGLELLGTNPLSFMDAPLDSIRKKVAIMEAFRNKGLEMKDIDGYIMERKAAGYSEQDIFNDLNTDIRRNYAKSGGGVVSGNSLYRKTLLNTFNISGEGKLFYRAVMGLVNYMNGWAHHSIGMKVDATFSGVAAVGHFLRGDTKAAGALFREFMIEADSVIKMGLGAAGLFMKAQRYEKDQDDMPEFKDWLFKFNNTLIAFDMIIGQHKNDYDLVRSKGEGAVEGFEYTAVGILSKYLRTIALTPKFVSEVWNTISTGNKNIFEAFEAAVNNNSGGFLKYTGQKMLDDAYGTMTNQSNLNIFGLGGDTFEDKLFEFKTKGANYAYFHEKGAMLSVFDYFKGWVSMGEYGIYRNTVDSVGHIKKEVMRGEGGKIINNYGITADGSNNSYNIKNILGNDETDLTEINIKNVDELWKQINYDIKDSLDSKGRNKNPDSIGVSKLDDIVTKQLRDKLEKQGLNLDEILNENNGNTAGLNKVMALMEHKGEGKEGQLIAYKIIKRQKELEKEMKKGVTKKGAFYDKVLSDSDITKAKRQALLENVKLLNLDAELVGKVLNLELQTNNKELYAKYNGTFSNKKALKEYERLALTEYISTRKINEGDSSVAYLTTRYSTLHMGFPDGVNGEGNQMAANVMIDTLQMIENSNQDKKTKVAKQAAAILGMDKANYNLLKDNKMFEYLSYDAKKQITDWVYKVSNDAIDFDSETAIKKGNKILHSGGNLKLQAKNKGEERPNFSKQFKPLQELANKLPLEYKSENPKREVEKYMNKYYKSKPFEFTNPAVKEYQVEVLRVMKEGLTGVGFIKDGSTQNNIAKIQKKNILTKTKRRLKNKPKDLKKVKVASGRLLKRSELFNNL